MRLATALLLLAAAGCDEAFGIKSVPPNSDTADASVDGPAPTMPADGSAAMCFGTAGRSLAPMLCIPANTVVPATLAATSINTDTACPIVIAQQDGPSLCVMVAQTISIAFGTTLSGHGSHPLVLIGENGITIDGTLDVSSTLAGAHGAGANTDCITTGIDGGPSSTGGAGGAGGSFGGAGGSGGSGSGVAGGTPAQRVLPLSIVRGGCPGGGGGQSNTGGTAESFGGGAVYLMSGQTITVSGTIDASGAGGTQGVNSSGGSGGGSGGLIGFDASSVVVVGSAKLFANGGGGGQGGVALAQPGTDPTLPLIAASGGASGGSGAGGNGAAGTATPSNGSPGGGGGGGGAGRILFFAGMTSVSSMAISPTPG